MKQILIIKHYVNFKFILKSASWFLAQAPRELASRIYHQKRWNAFVKTVRKRGSPPTPAPQNLAH